MKDVFGGGSETDVGRAHAAPSAMNGEEDIGCFGDEVGLLPGREHEVSVTERFGGESGKDFAADAEVGRAHVRAFFGSVEAEGDAAKVSGSHGGAGDT